MEETLGKNKTHKKTEKTQTRHKQKILDRKRMRMIIWTIPIQTLFIRKYLSKNKIEQNSIIIYKGVII